MNGVADGAASESTSLAARQPDVDAGLRQQRYENDEFAKMLGRLIRAYGRRVGEGDPFDLPDALELLASFEREVGRAVTALRERGYSWSEIGSVAGISRQAAQQRWGA